MSHFIWKLSHMFLSCNQIFCHTFERIFHANLDAYLKKLLKQKKITNLGQSILSNFFKAKINFKDAPTLGKQSTIDYELSKKNLTQNAQNYSCKSKQN